MSAPERIDPTAQAVRERANAAREQIAAESFDLRRVLSLVERFAAMGFQQVCVVPQRAMCLTHTEAAKRTSKELDDLGYCVTWETALYRQQDKRNPTGVPSLMASMVISWERKIGYLNRSNLRKV